MTNVLDTLSEHYGDLKRAAAALGVPYTTVHSWGTKCRIPDWRMDNIRQVAKRDGIELPEET